MNYIPKWLAQWRDSTAFPAFVELVVEAYAEQPEPVGHFSPDWR